MKSYTKNLLLILSFVAFSYEIKASEEENTPDNRTPLATAANLSTGIASIEGTGVDGSTTAVTGGATLTASTNNLSSVSKSLSAIEGTNFATGTDSLEVVSANLTIVDGLVDSILEDTGTTLPATLGTPAGADMSTDIAAVKTDTAAILADTTVIGAPVGASISADIAAVDTVVDTLATTIGSAVGADISADIASVQTDTTAILADTTVIGAPVGASISADIAAVKTVADSVQTDTTAILADTTVIGAPVGASISADIASVQTDTTATLADTVELLGQDVASGTVITGGTAYVADTNDLTSVSRGLSAIEGASFATGTASLYIIARQIALNQVISAGNSAVLALPVITADTTDDTFNANMIVVFDALTLALGTTNNTNVGDLDGDVDQAVTDAAALATLTSAYHKSAVKAAVQQLKSAVVSWLAFYP